MTRATDKLESRSENYQENGKIDTREEIPESCMIVLGKEDGDMMQRLVDKGESMHWEKVTQQEKSSRFDFVLAPNLKSSENKQLDCFEMGPMAMCYDRESGWVTEKLGPSSGHWKRIERTGKTKEKVVEADPTKLKREGPTPIDELETNIIDLKLRKGKNQVSKTLKGENISDGGEAVAARQHCRAQ